MIPVRDDQPRFSTPYVTYFLIAINVLIFLYELTLSGRALRLLEYQFGLVPAAVAEGLAGQSGLGIPAALLPLFTSMFLHGGWLHVLGNVWVLWIFGDNIEDYLGHFPYIVFYLLCGIGAGICHLFFNWGSPIPTVGASGAIAGVMGAYLLLYPKARVVTIVPLIVFFTFWNLPAWVVLGYWFIIQLFSGAASSVVQAQQGTAGGIAFWAHVGGFLLGMLLIKILPERRGRYRYGTW
jgi:membrane associated rhomboid family serine protease